MKAEESKYKFLIVSDAMHFALTDVYDGYVHALNKLNIPHEEFPWHHMRTLLSDGICYNIVHSTALIKDKGFTHVIFIGGLNIPDFLLNSLYGIKSIIIATEDPHSFDPMKNRLDKIDYYFTNEKSIAKANKYDNVYYLPTAANPNVCGVISEVEDKYKSDLLFLGALYPSRAKILESIIPFIETHGINLKICGHTKHIPEDTPLRKYIFEEGTVKHDDTIKYYNGAKIVLNMFRDVKWSPRIADKNEANRLNSDNFPGESLNPRAYEVPLCGSLMAMEDTREEARAIFSDESVAFFSSGKQLESLLYKYLIKGTKLEREKIAKRALLTVASGHTYIHRLQTLLDIIQST